MRLVDLFRGDLSYRELWSLLQYLPQDSWTQTILRDDPDRQALRTPERAPENPDFGPWALDNYQLAALIDAVNSVRFVLARVNGNKDYPAPEPMPRPGMGRAESVGAASEEALEAMREALEFLNSLRARRG